MQRWSGVLASRSLLREYQSWCPECLGHWHSTKAPIYTPLLWQMKPVGICSIHDLPLIDTCSNCGRRHRPLSWQWSPGYCPRCRAYLGNGTRSDARHPRCSPASEWELFKVKSISEIIELVPSLRSNPSLIDFARNVSELTCFFADGVALRFARLVNVSHDTIQSWNSGKQAPQLLRLLLLAYRLRLNPAKLLCSGIAAELADISVRAGEIQEQLRQPSRCIHDVGERLHDRFCRITPPKSLAAVARELNCDQSLIKRLHPEIAKEIIEAYKAHVRRRKENRHAKILAALKSAISSLRSAGIYPTRTRVALKLEKPNWWMERWVREDYQKLLLSDGPPVIK